MLKGVFPVLPTLFTEEDGLDLDALGRVIEFAVDSGAHGVVFPGVASEYDFLSLEERGELIAFVAQAAGGRVPIIGGASAPTATEVIVAGMQAGDQGIHHLMVMAPHGLGDDLDAHRGFFAEVTAGLPEASIILQNQPVPVGAGLSPEAMVDLARENPAISCVKEEALPSGPSISRLLAAEIPHLESVFGGGGARYAIDELERGALGMMPAVELTDLHVALFEAFQSGEKERARDLYRLSLPLLTCQAVYRTRFTKYVLGRRDIAAAPFVRAPHPEMDEMTRRDIDRMLQDLAKVFP